MHERDERDSALELPGLVRARRSRGRSQQDLARLSGVSKATIIRVEKGHKARISTAGKLADALGTSVAALSSGGYSGAWPPLWRAPRMVTQEEEERERPRVVLALAHGREEDDGEDLEEILGGAEALGDLQRLLEGSRGGVLAGVGLKDRSDAPRLGPGEGLSDEVETQRDARQY